MRRSPGRPRKTTTPRKPAAPKVEKAVDIVDKPLDTLPDISADIPEVEPSSDEREFWAEEAVDKTADKNDTDFVQEQPSPSEVLGQLTPDQSAAILELIKAQTDEAIARTVEQVRAETKIDAAAITMELLKSGVGGHNVVPESAFIESSEPSDVHADFAKILKPLSEEDSRKVIDALKYVAGYPRWIREMLADPNNPSEDYQAQKYHVTWSTTWQGNGRQSPDAMFWGLEQWRIVAKEPPFRLLDGASPQDIDNGYRSIYGTSILMAIPAIVKRNLEQIDRIGAQKQATQPQNDEGIMDMAKAIHDTGERVKVTAADGKEIVVQT